MLLGAVFRLDRLRRQAESEAAQYKALLRDVRTALAAGSEPLLRQAVPLANQAATQSRSPQTPLEQLEVAIFVCHDSSPRNRGQAQALQRLRPPEATKRWPRNYLSVATNASPTYRLVRNEIRYNPAEEDAANRLERLIREAGGEAAKVLTFFPSPNSISVFFCEGANPPPLPAEQSATAPATAVAR